MKIQTTLLSISIWLMVACSTGQTKQERLQATEEAKVHRTEARTALVQAKGVELVTGHCTPCHSARLITQNRATREGWLSMIRWMQATQNLWDLGEAEDEILDYLAEHYAPAHRGRRKPLTEIEWYELKH